MTPHKIFEMIEIAERALRKLDDAETSLAAREAWVAFLESSNRAINRLEGYAKKIGKLEAYKENVVNELWNDDLTAYMRSARNAHEHGIDDLDVDEEFSSRIIFPNGQIIGGPMIYGTTTDGRTVVFPQAGPTEFVSSDPNVRLVNLKPGIQLMPVISKKGKTLMPPNIAGLVREDEAQVHAVARTYLKWITEKIEQFTK